MVSVRKSHQMSQTSFEQWLTSIEVNQAKGEVIEKLWQQVKHHFEAHVECQVKSLEMVEILASLNLDKDSLCAAFLTPLIEYKCIEHYSKAIFMLC